MSDMFTFQWWTLEYLRHPYNRAAQNMRAVEIPIIREFLNNAGRGAVILEIGNVLSYYGPISWPVVDLQEQAAGVINADIMEWEPSTRFDLIVSISTLEHIGFGRFGHGLSVNPADVIARLRGWLTQDGLLAATIPTKYNPVWDAHLRAGTLGADRLYAMRRIISREINLRRPGGGNFWEECSVEEALDAPRGIWSGGMVVVVAGQY